MDVPQIGGGSAPPTPPTAGWRNNAGDGDGGGIGLNPPTIATLAGVPTVAAA
jgi:hypothetical protein